MPNRFLRTFLLMGCLWPMTPLVAQNKATATKAITQAPGECECTCYVPAGGSPIKWSLKDSATCERKCKAMASMKLNPSALSVTISTPKDKNDYKYTLGDGCI